VTAVLVGADVGGSKTAVAVGDGTRIAGRANGPGAAVRPGRAIVSAATIAETVRRALAAAGHRRGTVLVVGAAGAGRETERRELEQALRGEALADRLLVTTDIEIALAAAFGEGPGIVVIAGTGSVVIGRDAEGRILRRGGYGWQMGDEGSGYAIGRAALGAVSRAKDGRSPDTALTPLLFEVTRSGDFDALVRWAASAGPAEVAALAPHVLHTAERGDAVAQGIMDYAARELSQLVLGLVPEFPSGERVGVALMGGMLAEERSLRTAVLARLDGEPDLRPLATPVDAALGALVLAARMGEGP
jgi:N-acetylglucosamine kinase-like BadF-type ATPase